MKNAPINRKFIFRTHQRRFLTFIEMLLVMALVALVAGFAAVNIRRMIVEQRFLSDVERVVDLLRLSQNLSLIVGHDTNVTFASSGNQQVIDCMIGIDKLLPAATGAWQKEIDRSRMPLKSIKRIDFQGESVLANRSGRMALYFRSQGTVVPKGVVRLSSSIEEGDKTALVRYICLPGYSSPLFAAIDMQQIRCDESQENDLDHRLTFALQREVADRNVKEALEKQRATVPHPPTK